MSTGDELFAAVADLLAERRDAHGDRFELVREYAGCEPRLVSWAEARVQSEVSSDLAEEFPGGLFRHQERAIAGLAEGRNIVVATRTSSGKSLIYTIPIAQSLIASTQSTALLFFPTKALANDQLQTLSRRTEAILTRNGKSFTPHLVARYDGDTPSEVRPSVRLEGRILLTNPEMVHYSILDWHEQHWQRFLTGLRYVVLDEAHAYRGTFGSNMAMLLRRLLGVSARYGARPQFIATSATMAEPALHLRTLTGQEFELIGSDFDGSRQFPRRFYIVRPQGHAFATARALLEALVSRERRVLAFCLSRWAAEENVQHFRDEPERRIRVYKSGLLPSQRQEIERGLRNGSVRGVFATTPLELGVDIGSLDVCICIGLPNTMMSLWQQAGRVGRAGAAVIILIPEARPLDAYYAENPAELFERPSEPLAVNMESRTLAKWHYACALKEASRDIARIPPDMLDEPMATIARQHQSGALEDHIFHVETPHHEYNVRAGVDSVFDLKRPSEQPDMLGTINRSQIALEAAPNAIYRHDGDSYRVIAVNEREREVRLRSEYSRNRTQAFIMRNVQVLHCCASKRNSVLQVEQCDRLRLTEVLMSLTEKRPDGQVVQIWQGAQGLRPTILPTTGVVLTFRFPVDTVRDLELPQTPLERARLAWNGLASLVKGILPAVLGPCDLGDFDVHAQWMERDARLFLYDRAYDGIDLCLPAFERIEKLLTEALERLRACDCSLTEGCFKCVRHPFEDLPTSRLATEALLGAVCRALRDDPLETTFREAADRLEVDPGRIPCPDCAQLNDFGARFCQNCGKSLVS